MLSEQVLNVTIVGTGYVGLSTAAVLAALGHRVTGLDVAPDKIEGLRRGDVHLYEPGLPELLRAAAPRLRWTTDYAEAIPGADVIFICVGTPPSPDGRPDLRFVEEAARSIARHLDGPGEDRRAENRRFQVIVNKSTVPIGTGDWVSRLLAEHAPHPHGAHLVVSNPEFLREGSALHDSLYPDRIVLGGHRRAVERLRALYTSVIDQSFVAPADLPRPEGYGGPAVVETSLESAEMIKYAANAFLALKISFANEIAGLCERVGADITEVTRGIGFDRRIGHQFLAAGAGWGGSCFGKDTGALISTGHEYGYDLPILEAAVSVNRRQRGVILEKLQRHLRRLQGKRVAVLGLAFKPGTDDLRDAPARDFVSRLAALGATVVVHDPVAMARARVEWADLRYAEAPSARAALAGADAAIVATEWPEYIALDWNAAVQDMRSPIVVDARGVVPLPLAVPAVVEQVGRPEPLAAERVAGTAP